jgi:hypothetical protein
MQRFWPVCGLCSIFLACTLAACPASFTAVDDKLPDDARSALENAKELELIGLWPFEDGIPKKQGKDAKVKDIFHKYEVTERKTIKREDARKAADAVLKGITEGKSKALCFDPHHGIRVAYKGKTYDFVICLLCETIHCYDPDGGVAAIVPTSKFPEATLDLLLAAKDTPPDAKDDK